LYEKRRCYTEEGGVVSFFLVCLGVGFAWSLFCLGLVLFGVGLALQVKRAISKNDSKKKTKKGKRRGECWEEQIKGKKKNLGPR
jgi:hypothetical protein